MRLVAATMLAVIVPLIMIDDSPAAGETESQSVAYYALKPSFVTNLASGGRYLRCDLQLMTHDAEKLPEVARHAPAIRHELLLLLSTQDGNTLKTAQGRARLRKLALAAVRQVVERQVGVPVVDELYITGFLLE